MHDFHNIFGVAPGFPDRIYFIIEGPINQGQMSIAIHTTTVDDFPKLQTELADYVVDHKDDADLVRFVYKDSPRLK